MNGSECACAPALRFHHHVVATGTDAAFLEDRLAFQHRAVVRNPCGDNVETALGIRHELRIVPGVAREDLLAAVADHVEGEVGRLTSDLELGNTPGLIDAIGYGQDFENVILRDTVTGLAVIPAGDVGRHPFSPLEALEAPGFAQRLVRLKAHFDTIIIDAPPLLPVADSRILSSYADEIVLVATWGKTPRHLLRKAIRLIGANATRVTGIVLNRMELTEATPAKKRRREEAAHLEMPGNAGAPERKAA